MLPVVHLNTWTADYEPRPATTEPATTQTSPTATIPKYVLHIASPHPAHTLYVLRVQPFCGAERLIHAQCPRRGLELSSDPNRPNFVAAPSPEDQQREIELFVEPTTIRHMLARGHGAATGHYAALIHGRVMGPSPSGEPVPVVSTGGLLDSVALFQGIKRPIVEAGLEREVYAYVLIPELDYYWSDRTNPHSIEARHPFELGIHSFCRYSGRCGSTEGRGD